MRFYRYRTPDGVVDYYDEHGNNSRKFLMRRPVRGENVRLTSGFGMRFHPLLNERRMHTGVDWATSPGTPVLAAGNGVIEEAGRKGQYGNYIRIRHPNGYQTAYGHMLRLQEGHRARRQGAPGRDHRLRRLDRPRLGPAPALRGADQQPLRRSLEDPGAARAPAHRPQLAEFQKERTRIDDLRHLAPVMTASK